MNNGVLPVVVSEAFLAEIFSSVENNPKTIITVDLQNQTVTNTATNKSEKFDINSYKKECFLQGFDDIDYLLAKKQIIEQYEDKQSDVAYFLTT